MTRGGDPWAPHRGKALEGGDIVRSNALRAVERVKGELVPDDGRAMAQDLIENGDPRGRDLAAQWALVSSDPLYRSAFEKVLANPTHGHRMWTADELGAYQQAELVRTAMSLTDSAGGYLVPFTLDPTIILTNSGVTGSIRSIAEKRTTATDTWNGVTSAGVTAEWLAELGEAADASPPFDDLVITRKGPQPGSSAAMKFWGIPTSLRSSRRSSPTRNPGSKRLRSPLGTLGRLSRVA